MFIKAVLPYALTERKKQESPPFPFRQKVGILTRSERAERVRSYPQP